MDNASNVRAFYTFWSFRLRIKIRDEAVGGQIDSDDASHVSIQCRQTVAAKIFTNALRCQLLSTLATRLRM